LVFRVPIKAEIVIVDHWEQESQGAEAEAIIAETEGGAGTVDDGNESEDDENKT
jgi:hypothetical protein